VFLAALEQSEQLMRAAEEVGYAARPLALFYSLSQAGRAIAATRLLGETWRLAGHGLHEPFDQVGVDLMHRRIKPQKGSGKVDAQGRRDSFSGVAAASGSGWLTGDVVLGEAWCAIPEMLNHPQMPDLDPTWRRPLIVWDELWDADPAFAATRLFSGGILVAGLPEHANVDWMTAELSHYPGAAGLQVHIDRHMGVAGTTAEITRGYAPTGELCPRLRWADSSRLLDHALRSTSRATLAC
jgi:hypothetical protein